jgi:hypothetical protein
MLHLESLDLLLVALDGCAHGLVPVPVELLELMDMSLFDFLSLLGLVVEEFVSSSVEFLVLQLSDSLVSHLSFYNRGSYEHLAMREEGGSAMDMITTPTVHPLSDTYLRIFPQQHKSFCVLREPHY